MNTFDPISEVTGLKSQTRSIRQGRYGKSRLDKFGGELIAMKIAGASIAELHRWIRNKRVKVKYSTVYRWMKKHDKLQKSS